MKIKLRMLQILAILLLNTSVNVYADSWNCSHDDLVREVMIEYPQGGSIPCDVVYKKQTEGVEDQVLWSAENQEGYCEEKAGEFVAKLESWGWVCLETVSQESSSDASTEASTEVSTEASTEASTVAEESMESESDPAAGSE